MAVAVVRNLSDFWSKLPRTDLISVKEDIWLTTRSKAIFLCLGLRISDAKVIKSGEKYMVFFAGAHLNRACNVSNDARVHVRKLLDEQVDQL